jgi:transcriptional regulator with XRE-family HTH domain
MVKVKNKYHLYAVDRFADRQSTPLSMDKRLLAQTVQRLRKDYGLSQESLCAKAGFSKTVIQEIESGEGNPTLDSLVATAGAFGVPLLDLFENQDIDLPRAPTREELIGHLIFRLTALNDLELNAIIPPITVTLERALSSIRHK